MFLLKVETLYLCNEWNQDDDMDKLQDRCKVKRELISSQNICILYVSYVLLLLSILLVISLLSLNSLLGCNCSKV